MKRGILILAAILLASNAYAVTNRFAHIDTDCPTNGDGTVETCADGDGLPGAFSNLCNAYTAELALGTNLRAGGRDIMLYFYARGATPDTCTNTSGGVQFGSGFLVDATHFPVLMGAPVERGAHPGYWSENHYRIVNASTSSSLRVYDRSQVWNVQVYNTGGSDSYAINGSYSIFPTIIQNNLVRCDSGLTTGIVTTNGALSTTENKIVNNVIMGCEIGLLASSLGNPMGGSPQLRVGFYNNTIIDSSVYGIRVNTCANGPFTCGEEEVGGAMVKMCNNLIQGSGTADISLGTDCEDWPDCFPQCGANTTSDATSPDGSAFQNQTASFKDVTNNNYQLQYNDTACLRRAEDLSQDSFYPVTTDNQSQTRATSGNDCGGDYVPPEEISTHRLRSGLKDRIKKLHQ